MKKIIFIFLASVVCALLLFIIGAIYISFTIVKPTTEAINRNLAKFLSRIIYIPGGIPPPIYGFESTNYFWEMETPAGEVTPIRFNFTPAYPENQNTIVATLEMPEGGDASIFTKVFPAVIADEQSLKSAQDPQKANLSANSEIGYSKINLFLKPETGQTIKVVWEFDKQNLDSETLRLYSQLEKYPQALLKFLHGLPTFILSLFSV